MQKVRHKNSLVVWMEIGILIHKWSGLLECHKSHLLGHSFYVTYFLSFLLAPDLKEIVQVLFKFGCAKMQLNNIKNIANY